MGVVTTMVEELRYDSSAAVPRSIRHWVRGYLWCDSDVNPTELLDISLK